MRGRQQERRRGRWVAAAVGAAVTVAAVTAGVCWPRAAAAKQAVVTNLQGQTFTGDVTEDDTFVYVNSAGGQLRLDKRNVAKVDYASDVDTQYQARHAKLGPADVKGRSELAHWANEHGRPDLALSALEEARQIDPANRDVALQVDAVQRQMDLDRRQGKAAGGTPPVATTPAKPAAGGPASTAPAMAGAPVIEHRLLTMAEVNAVRQVEMRTGDRLIKVRLENNLARRYGKAAGVDVNKFLQQTPEEQALEILKFGTPDMAKDVHILTDPTPLQLFKTKVMPIVAQACGSPACHGGTKGGDFMLYPGETTQALYTNFYILQTYSSEIGGIRYLTVDREVPERSLVLQYGLPTAQGRPPHPAAAEFKPRFKNRDDVAYGTVDDWITDDLRVLQPDYGFPVSPRLLPKVAPVSASTTAPAAVPPPLPTTRPIDHGVPLPRTPEGAVTQPSP